jgi:hypothetical protein
MATDDTKIDPKLAERIQRARAEDPTISNVALARKLAISRPTVIKYRRKISDEAAEERSRIDKAERVSAERKIIEKVRSKIAYVDLKLAVLDKWPMTPKTVSSIARLLTVQMSFIRLEAQLEGQLSEVNITVAQNLVAAMIDVSTLSERSRASLAAIGVQVS